MIQSEIQNLLNYTANFIQNPYRLATGLDIETLTVIINNDNSIPYCRKITAREDKMLALDADYSLSSNIYRFTIVNEELDLNSQFWLSTDNGNSYEKVNVLREQSRCFQSYWWLFIEQQN